MSQKTFISVERSIFIKIVSILVITTFFSGCSVTKTIIPSASSETKYNNADYAILAIDGRDIVKSKVVGEGSYTITINNGEALLESIKNEARKYFKDVYIVSDKDSSNYDLFMYLNNQQISMIGNSSAYFNTQLTYNVMKHENDKTYLNTGELLDQYVLPRSGSVLALGIITGITLMLIAPITFPIMADSVAEDLKEQVSLSNDRISKKLVNKLVADKINLIKSNTTD